jgi:hypothetical protein
LPLLDYSSTLTLAQTKEIHRKSLMRQGEQGYLDQNSPSFVFLNQTLVGETKVASVTDD